MPLTSLPAGHPTDRVLGRSPAMATLRAQIRHLAAFDRPGSALVPTLLLQGETGTGKSLVARVVHDSGPRATGPFLAVNCAAIPESMVEAELFGFEAGAFTDAKRAKPGLFEAASGGTLFLDEIDALTLPAQGKVLTALESKQVRRLGATTERTVDVKVIAATNADLGQRIRAGQLRADLYHRLAVLVLVLPPLRARGEDIVVLADQGLAQYGAAHEVPVKRLTPGAVTWLQGYGWPGNVRELSHLMERVTLLHLGEEVDGPTLEQWSQPLGEVESRGRAAPLEADAPTAETAPQSAEVATRPVELAVPAPPAGALGEAAEAAEAGRLRQALEQTGWNVAQTAQWLGMSRDMLRYRLRRYGIARPRPGASSASQARSVPSLPSHWHPPGAAETATPTPIPTDPSLPSHRPVAPPSRMPEEPGPAPPGPRHHGPTAHDRSPTPDATWEQKPVAIVMLEVTWPTPASGELPRYDPWTEAARWEQAMVEKVQGFGGVLLQRAPALLTWVFGLPQALEQLPQRAVHSALALRQMVAVAQAPDLGPCPAVRLAVHLGAVQVERPVQIPPTRVLAVGDTLALPVRLLGQAGPGEVVVSPEVGRLVAGWVALEAREVWQHTGAPAGVGGYAVVGARPGPTPLPPGAGQPRTPFVGRTRELALLEAVWEQVQAGQGQVVGLMGAAGMGKSRLLTEWQQRCSAEETPYYQGECLAYGSATPYLPVLGLLRAHCDLTEADRPEALTTKVRLALESSGSDQEVGVPVLLDLLGVPVEAARLAGLSAEARRARAFAMLCQMFLASSQRQPLVLAVDNLHWIDPTSEAFLARLIEQMAGVPLLVLTTTRPGYRPPWVERSYVTQLALAPLGPEASRQVVRRVLADRPLPPDLEQQLLARAEGNPFFLEELAHTVREQAGAVAGLAVPDTIQAVLAARLDRLPAPEQRLLQAAAVIGKDIALPLLEALLGLPEATMQGSLAHLQAAEFVFPTRMVPTPTYTFKHILTHEVVYKSLLQEQRRALHARIVDTVERLYSDRLAEQIEGLALHALRGEVWDKALGYFHQAGAKAAARSAYREAVACFEQALVALTHLPETRETREQAIDLRFDLRTALYALGEHGRILAYLREAETLAEALADQRQLGRVCFYMSAHLQAAGDQASAIASAQRTLAIAESLGDFPLQVVANICLGVAYLLLGDSRQASTFFRRNIESLEGDRVWECFGMAGLPSVMSRTWLIWCLAELGEFAQGSTLGAEAVRIAEAADQLFSMIHTAFGVGHLYLRKGEFHLAVPILERGVQLCQRGDVRLLFPEIGSHLGYAYALSGRLPEALPLLEQAVEQAASQGFMREHALHVAWLGEAYLLDGRMEVALQTAQRALELAHQYNGRGHEAWSLWLLGKIAAHRDSPDVDQAEAHYHQALALAEDLGMRPLQAHCHLGLGTLSVQMGRLELAHTALTAAVALYRAMEMTFWLPQAETVLAQVS